MNKHLPLALLLLGACASPAFAAAPEATPVEGCVELSDAHQGVRFGAQYLFVKDGDAHYRVGFGGSCEALSSGAVAISTDGEANRLCAAGTKVKARQAECDVRSVEAVDQATFARYSKKRRR